MWINIQEKVPGKNTGKNPENKSGTNLETLYVARGALEPEGPTLSLQDIHGTLLLILERNYPKLAIYRPSGPVADYVPDFFPGLFPGFFSWIFSLIFSRIFSGFVFRIVSRICFSDFFSDLFPDFFPDFFRIFVPGFFPGIFSRIFFHTVPLLILERNYPKLVIYRPTGPVADYRYSIL